MALCPRFSFCLSRPIPIWIDTNSFFCLVSVRPLNRRQRASRVSQEHRGEGRRARESMNDTFHVLVGLLVGHNKLLREDFHSLVPFLSHFLSLAAPRPQICQSECRQKMFFLFSFPHLLLLPRPPTKHSESDRGGGFAPDSDRNYRITPVPKLGGNFPL